MLRILLCLIIASQTVTAMAQKKKFWHTHPQPPRATKADPLRVFPGIQIPNKPERYTWQTTLKYNGKDSGYSNIRLFLFDGNRRSQVGDIPAGTKIELNEVRQGGSNLYYSVPFVYNAEGANPQEQYAWIQGAHIEPTAFSADAK